MAAAASSPEPFRRSRPFTGTCPPETASTKSSPRDTRRHKTRQRFSYFWLPPDPWPPFPVAPGRQPSNPSRNGKNEPRAPDHQNRDIEGPMHPEIPQRSAWRPAGRKPSPNARSKPRGRSLEPYLRSVDQYCQLWSLLGPRNPRKFFQDRELAY